MLLQMAFSSIQSLSRVLTLCDPMDCSPLGSSVHGNFPGIALALYLLDGKIEIQGVFISYLWSQRAFQAKSHQGARASQSLAVNFHLYALQHLFWISGLFPLLILPALCCYPQVYAPNIVLTSVSKVETFKSLEGTQIITSFNAPVL